MAGLPSGGASGSNNTAEFMIVGRVNRFDIIESRQALPLDGNIGELNKHIINPEKVKLFDFSILKP
ncbi:MAG: hypothetical protein MJZ22_03200 [Candidatus Saccharibacteria bacterium]|nr:hypothetical protein [Candidatus Saccharibacteria bacterium]